MTRPTMRPSVRFEVFERDGFRCCYCGNRPPDVLLEVDHIIPLARGGLDAPVNLITSCKGCNRGKGARMLEQVPGSYSPNLEEKQEHLAQIKAIAETAAQEKQLEEEMLETVSHLWISLEGLDPEKYAIEGEDEAAVRKFLGKLPLDEVMEAVQISHDKFQSNPPSAIRRFFCGICWKKVERRQRLKELQLADALARAKASLEQLEKENSELRQRIESGRLFSAVPDLAFGNVSQANNGEIEGGNG